VERAVSFLRASSWNCWPESGGWAEQDARLVEDVLTYIQLEQRVQWEVEHHELVESAGMDDMPRLTL